jgi:hypothetical protein
METDIIYRCTKISPFYGLESPWGYFRNNHEIDKILSVDEDAGKLFFYEITGWALNPTNEIQRKNWITLSTYLANGTLYCSLQASRYILHPNRLENIRETQFLGRESSDIILRKGEKCWYYDTLTKTMCTGEILETPPMKEEGLCGEWMDDSYLIRTGPGYSHTHVLSPYVFKYSQFID